MPLGVSFAQFQSVRKHPKINVSCCRGKSDSQQLHEHGDASLESFKFGSWASPSRSRNGFGHRLSSPGESLHPCACHISKGNTFEFVLVLPSKSASKTLVQSVNPRAADDIFGWSCAPCEPL